MAGPSTIGRYNLVRRVGAGGMGVVYEAVDTRDGRKCALKVLLPHAAEDDEGLLRFKREFRAMARLRHPSIVRVFDAGIEDDTPFIAMEFLEGKDVRTYLRTFPEGPARDRETVRILRQIFGALAHIHARRIVHRDLKPENILVTKEGRVKMMDFGVARVLRAPTNSSGLLGTFAYMAPEQVTSAEIDGRADLYAVGILIYELLTGKYPFPVEPPAAALHHHVHTPPELIRHINPRADPTLTSLAHRLLEKDPLDRLQSAEESINFLKDMEAAGASLPDVNSSMPGELFVPRFVGREGPLEALDGMVSDAAAGRGKLVILEGPSGVGKSRLVEELRLRVRRRSHVLVGQCMPEGMVDYGPFTNVLDTIAAIAHRAPDDVVHRIVGRDVALVSAVSPRLARLGGSQSTRHLDGAERKIRLHKAVVGVIGRLALTKAVVLVIEDLHWADNNTLELIWDAARTLLAPRPGGVAGETVCPVAIVLTRRSLAEGPDHAESLIRRLEERGGLERMLIAPIPRSGVAEMVRTMTGVAKPMTAMVDELMDFSHGLPLMVQEILHSWLSDRILKREKGVWYFRGKLLDAGEKAPKKDDLPVVVARSLSAAPPSAPTAVPKIEPSPKSEPAERASSTERRTPPRKPGKDDMVLAKLKKLSAASRSLVERLALTGRLLPSDLVSAVADLGEDELLDAIDELVRADVLAEELSADGVSYRFYHEETRDALIRSLGQSRRRETHLLLARTLERRFAKRRRELATVLARHFRYGGQPERAIRYLVMWSQAASGRGDLDGAMKRLDDAIALLDDRPATAATATRRLNLVIRQIDLLLDFGRAREALDRSDPQAAIAARDPGVTGAELLLRKAACHFALGKLDEALATLGRIPKRPATRSLAARALELEGRTRIARGEYSQARAVLQKARDTAEDAGLLDLAQGLDATIGVVMLYQGDYAGALVKLETGLRAARARGEIKQIAELVGHIGMIHAARDNSTEALACYREALELAEARGIRSDRERWSGALGVLMTDLGDFEEAHHKLDEALEIARETGDRQGEAMWRGELGIHHFRAGHLDQAAQELTRCLAIARDIGFLRYEGWAQIHLGAITMERNFDKLEEAEERIQAGLEIAQEIGNEELRIVGLAFLGRLQRAAGDHRRGKESIERAEVLAVASQNLRLRARIREALARRA